MASRKIEHSKTGATHTKKLFLLTIVLSLVIFDAHGQTIPGKAQVVHPIQAMVLRATDFSPSPIMFYGENGRVHVQYRPFLPKFLYTVSVLGELMRGVGATVNEVLHRAAVAYPGPQYAPYHSPYYMPYTTTKTSTSLKTSNANSSPTQLHHNYNPEQRSQVISTTQMPIDILITRPLQISLESQVRPSYMPRPEAESTTIPPQAVKQLITRAFAGA